MSKTLLVRTEPLSDDVLTSLGLDRSKVTCAELSAGTELYSMVCGYIADTHGARSFTIDIGKSSRRGECCDSDDSGDEQDGEARAACKDLGLGVFSFSFESSTSKSDSSSPEVLVSTIHALHQTLGEVVGTNCGPALMKSLVLISPNGIEPLTSFCDKLIEKADATSDFKFNIYRWHVQYNYWRKAEVAKARSIESVVLPDAVKSKLVDDLSEFVSTSTKAWYAEHGVPYKRSYLLHGTPGAGKTSLIQALAGAFKRNICYLSSLSHPEMTDDNLKNAVQRCPAKSIVVLEDVDSLFGDGRRKRDGDKSALTFSGVLNALDGVGASTGQIFILTTNHRERLDPALIRNGRVDCHIEFTDATAEQMRKIFCQFYRDAPPALSEQFTSTLCELLGERTVSMALLQHYFISMRKEPAEVAAVEVAKILEEAEAHGLAKKDAEAAKDAEGTKDAAADKTKAGKDGKGEAEGEGEGEGETDSEGAKKKAPKGKKGGGGASGKEIHVHVHVD